MNKTLRWLFYMLLVRPIVLVVLGLNVRHRERLARVGPAIIVANHNSHLDAMVLMTLFPGGLIPKLHPVAAQDYFCRNRLLKWFSLNIVGIIPLERQIRTAREHPFAAIDAALERGEIVIIFPEGSRGEPERLSEFKAGIAHLAQRHSNVPISPVYLHGLGKALPRGEAVLVPFFCDIFIGEPFSWCGDRKAFMQDLSTRMTSLAAEGNLPQWE